MYKPSVSEPIDVPLDAIIPAVYRLWDANGVCLYVGQTTQIRPELRIISHRSKPWWPEVARADYVIVRNPDALTQVEYDQTVKHRPRYSKAYPAATKWVYDGPAKPRRRIMAVSS
jgi:hypothetical protein